MSDEEALPLTVAIDSSYKRVLRAEWASVAREGADYYCCQLDCGHHMHISEDMLRSPLLCLFCCRQALGEAGQL